MQYPVYPYVVATYDTHVLDLRSSVNFRNLAKPIAIQHTDKEEKFIHIYQTLDDAYNLACANKQDNDQQKHETISSVLGHHTKPYHFSSLYSNSGVVLHYLVRLLPYTRMFLEYQDRNFDCADRTFHDVKTSYWLSSFESTSDFKEIIPEFYYLHEFLLNKQGFNFGSRQNVSSHISSIEYCSNIGFVCCHWHKSRARKCPMLVSHCGRNEMHVCSSMVFDKH
jgi:lysosomal-trafficking regulator